MLFSCAKEIKFLEQPVQEVKTYTLTVEAGKGERPDTKALDIDGNKLKTTWAVTATTTAHWSSGTI